MRTLAMAATAALVAATAAAGPVFDSGITPEEVDTGFASDPDEGKQQASPFVLADPVVLRGVAWSGLYSTGASPQEVDRFTLSLYADDAGLPGAVLAADVTLASTRAASGETIDVSDIYEYAADLPDLAMPGGETLWISIVNDTTEDANDDWFWSFGPSETTPPGTAFRELPAGPWLLATTAKSHAFALFAETLSAPEPEPEAGRVPLPPAAALLGLALAGLGLARRRRQGAESGAWAELRPAGRIGRFPIRACPGIRRALPRSAGRLV
ncbi:MAG: hypothetical protein R6V44_16680 [Paracoccaceae bacterium]